MSDITDSDIAKPPLENTICESAWIKTLRLTINLFTNVLICLTVFVTLLYGFNTEKVTSFHLHIILCVLGYQLLMCQGTLVLSKFNSWSIYLSRRFRKYLHVVFQLLGFILAVGGSSAMMIGKQSHFNSTHGTLGVIALITSAISIFNGVSAYYAHKLSRNYIFMIKFVHFTSGTLCLFISAAALTTGFEVFPFKMWMNNEDALTALISITYVFTFLVALDFWLLTVQRLRRLVV